MKGFLKQRKGFSLVELLIALLIMAIIAGTAITLFGGVLETSRGGADRETADAIKRAILTYMNSSNDTDLSCMGVGLYNKAAGTFTYPGTAQDLVDRLGGVVSVTSTDATYDVDAYKEPDGTTVAAVTGTGTKNYDDMVGTYGPLLETPGIVPTQADYTGWDIKINIRTQVITVAPMKPDATTGALNKIEFED